MKSIADTSCVCGKVFAFDPPAAETSPEWTCDCGRKYELGLRGGAWAPVSEPLIPEPRQPLAGFSRELRLLEDCQRFYFVHSINRRGKLPVHILFSRSSEQAEVTTGDMKPLRIAPVRSVVEARRLWIEWFDPLRSKGSRGPQTVRPARAYESPTA